MGVDIYGISPNLKGKCPQVPDNYEELSEEQKATFWKEHDQWHEDNPGYYFRNNWWHWRPLQCVIASLNLSRNIGIPESEIKHLAYNDGVGISDAGHCQQLAEAFKEVIASMEEGNIEFLNANYDMWEHKVVNEKGELITVAVKDQDIIDKLRAKYGGFFLGQAELDDVQYYSYHQTNLDNLKEFAVFLENCNGFTIH